MMVMRALPVSLRDVDRSFDTPTGPRRVLSAVDLEIRAGQIVVVLGEGCNHGILAMSSHDFSVGGQSRMLKSVLECSGRGRNGTCPRSMSTDASGTRRIPSRWP